MPLTKKGSFSAAEMQTAVDMVTKEGLGLKTVVRTLAARGIKIDRATLRRRVQQVLAALDPNSVDLTSKLGRHMKVFTATQEEGLAKYLLTCSNMYQGLSIIQTRQLAYQYAKKLGKTLRTKTERSQLLSDEWFHSFRVRNPQISVRKPEGTSLQRARAFNRANVEAFFGNYDAVLQKTQVGPDKIWNLDETGLSSVAKTAKLVAPKGQKQVGVLTSGDRGVNVTVVGCVNAVGNSLPPCMIFPRVYFKEHMIRGAPAGTLGLAQASGWMTNDLFPKCLQHFINHMKCSVENPHVLVMDNHSSHLSLAVVDLARTNGLHIVTFPPHCSNKLQPLDKAVYGPLKTYYATAAQEFLLSRTGKEKVHLTIYEIAEIFGRVYHKSFSTHNILAGFTAAGVFPVNRFIFTEADFAPADALNRVIQEADHDETAAAAVAEDAGEPDTTPITPESVRPYPKAPLRQKPEKGGRKVGKTCILTSTPEKRRLEEEALKTVKRSRVTKTIKRMRLTTDVEVALQRVSEGSRPGTSGETIRSDLEAESDDEDSEKTPVESEDEGSLSDDLDPEDPEKRVNSPGDFVLVRLVSETGKTSANFVGQITAVHEGAVTVKFLKASRKSMNCFFFDRDDDFSFVKESDIILNLPKPVSLGETARAKSHVRFDTDLSSYNPN